MPLPGSGSPSRPIAWVLLSQAIGLPLLGIDLQDRWPAQRRLLAPGGPAPTALLPGNQPAAGQMRWAQPSTAAASAAGVAAPPLSLAELRQALGPSPAAAHAGPAAATASLLYRRRIGQTPLPATGLLLRSGGPLASPPRSDGWGAPPAAITAVRSAGTTAAMATPTANTTAAATAATPPAASPAGALASQRRPGQRPAGLALPSRAAPLPLSRWRGSQLLGGALGLEDLPAAPVLLEPAQRSGRSDPP